MERRVRLALMSGVVLVGACSNGPRRGWDTIGAGATPGESGGAPLPPATGSAAGSVAPTMTATDTTKRTVDTAAKKRATIPRKP